MTSICFVCIHGIGNSVSHANNFLDYLLPEEKQNITVDFAGVGEEDTEPSELNINKIQSSSLLVAVYPTSNHDFEKLVELKEKGIISSQVPILDYHSLEKQLGSTHQVYDFLYNSLRYINLN